MLSVFLCSVKFTKATACVLCNVLLSSSAVTTDSGFLSLFSIYHLLIYCSPVDIWYERCHFYRTRAPAWHAVHAPTHSSSAVATGSSTRTSFRAKMPKPISLALNHCFRKKKSLLVKSVKYAGPVQCQNIFYFWNKSLPVKSEDSLLIIEASNIT